MIVIAVVGVVAVVVSANFVSVMIVVCKCFLNRIFSRSGRLAVLAVVAIMTVVVVVAVMAVMDVVAIVSIVTNVIVVAAVTM